MKLPRLRWLLLVPLGLVLLPPLAWVLAITVAPTNWAREKIVARLSAATGRTVRLHSLSVGLCGAVHLENLEIAAPQSSDDPWLKVADAKINVNCFHLLTGHVEPTEVQIEGVVLRVLRHKDGSLELSDLLQAPSAPTAKPSAPETASTECPGLDVVLKDARITLIDEPSQTRLELEDVEGKAKWAGARATISKIQGKLNGGPFELAAQLDQSQDLPAFEGQIRAHDVALSEGMTALGYLVPVFAGTSDGRLQGKLALNVYVRGQGDSLERLRKKLVGHGAINLDPIQLDGSKLLAELSRVADLTSPGERRVGAVKTDFTIKEGRISTDDLTLNVGKVPIVLSGWTDFNGKLDYRLKTDTLTEKLPGKARNLLSELDIKLTDLTQLKVQGSVENLVVTLDGVPLHENKPGSRSDVPKGDDKQRYRELGRRLRDKILR